MAKAIKSETKPVMTFEELKESPEYAACSDKMKLWLATLAESNFDYKLATATAFNCKNRRQAHVFSYAVRKWPVIRAALSLYLGRSERDIFLQDLEQTIRRAPKGSVAQVRAQALYARLKFGVNADATEPEAETAESKTTPAVAESETKPVFHVGDIAILDGKKYRVLEIDGAGSVTEAEPL